MYKEDIELLNKSKAKKPIRSYLLRKSKEIKKKREEQKKESSYSIKKTSTGPIDEKDMPKLKKRENMPKSAEKTQTQSEGFRPVFGLKERPILPGPPKIEEEHEEREVPKTIKKKIPEKEIETTAISDMINGFVEMTLNRIDSQSSQSKIHVFSTNDIKEIMRR